jgi:hypothetical protein
MPKCFFPAWLFAWVVAIFLPSAIIAYLGLSPAAAEIGVGFDNIFATTWKVGDDVGPFAKLSFGALSLAQFFAVQRMRLERIALVVVSVVAGAFAMTLALALLPAEYSRGFGVGLSGERFQPTLTAIYALGGALAGAMFAFALQRCGERG